MHRLPPQQGGSADSQQQPTVQSQQFPNPQQFPPEQQGAAVPGQRPPLRFPHSTLPPQAQPAVQQPAPQNPQAPAQPNPAQQAPETPSGLALKPASPPRVSFAGGQLTVVADNSSLADILSSVERTTGAHLEGAQPDSERVFGQFGPGTPRQVLNLLLTGSHFDFILTGAIDDPGGVQRIMLSQHGASPLGIAQASNKAEARQNTATPAQEEEETNEVAAPPPMPEPQPAPQVNQSEQQQGQPGAQPQVKTPEQLLQELQRLRQQQQQQQTNPSSPR